MSTQIKRFPTIDVLQVLSGYILREGGFAGVHAIMNHFFPGIMTIGVAALAKRGAAEVVRQCPKLAALPEYTDKTWETWRDTSLAALPPDLPLTGPLTNHMCYKCGIELSPSMAEKQIRLNGQLHCWGQECCKGEAWPYFGNETCAQCYGSNDNHDSDCPKEKDPCSLRIR